MKNRVVTDRELLEQVKELTGLIAKGADFEDIQEAARAIADHKDIINPYLAQEHD